MRAIAVDVLVFAGFRALGQHIGRRLVQGGGPQAAPKGQHHRPVVQAQLFAGGLPLRGQHLSPHRVAGDHAVDGAVEVLLGVGHGQHHRFHGFGQHFGGDAGVGVGLVDDAGDAQLGGLPDDRAADVAPGAHAHIRPEGFDDALGLGAGGEHPHHGLGVAHQVLGRQLSLKAGDVHGLDLEPRLGNQALLHAPLVPHIEDLGVRLLLEQVARRRQGRVDVPRGAAAGEENFHSKSTSFPSVWKKSVPAALRLLNIGRAGDVQQNAHLSQQHQ